MQNFNVQLEEKNLSWARWSHNSAVLWNVILCSSEKTDVSEEQVALTLREEEEPG
jgi:hypothetical protein